VDRDGRPEEIRFSIPGADYIVIWGLAGIEDGTIVLRGAAYSGERTGGSFISIIPPDRSKTTVVRLVPYDPEVITVTPDGIIWTIGYDAEKGQQNVLKRFDLSGNVLSSSLVKIGGKTNGGGGLGSTMRASGDRVGWLTNLYDYVEFSLGGSETYRSPGPPWHPISEVFTTFAMSSDGQVVAALRQPTQPEPTMWILDRRKRAWSPIDAAGAGIGETADLLGFDGEDLVVRFWARDRGSLMGRFSLLPPKLQGRKRDGRERP
jgi:hypothetical protein